MRNIVLTAKKFGRKTAPARTVIKSVIRITLMRYRTIGSRMRRSIPAKRLQALQYIAM